MNLELLLYLISIKTQSSRMSYMMIMLLVGQLRLFFFCILLLFACSTRLSRSSWHQSSFQSSVFSLSIPPHNHQRSYSSSLSRPYISHYSTNYKTDCFDPQKIDPNIICIEVYDPVCGCDQYTYPNVCYAKREGSMQIHLLPCLQCV